jgi:hypothetical protein
MNTLTKSYRRKSTKPSRNRSKKYSTRKSTSNKSSGRKFPSKLSKNRSKKSSSRNYRRKSTKPSRSKKSFKLNFNGDSCKLHLKKISEKELTNFVKILLKSQNRRIEIAEELKNTPKFGMIDRKIMINRNKHRRTPKTSNVTKAVIYVKSKVSDLVNIFKSTLKDPEKRHVLFSYIDVGIRLPYNEPDSVSNFIVNAVVYGQSLKEDWQFWLGLPVAQKMFFEMVNDRKNILDFIFILQKASVSGVKVTDMFYGIPNMGIDICDPKRYEWVFTNYLKIGINVVGRIGQAKLLEFIEKKISEGITTNNIGFEILS